MGKYGRQTSSHAQESTLQRYQHRILEQLRCNLRRKILDLVGHAELRQRPAHADHGHRPRRLACPFSQRENRNGVLRTVSGMTTRGKSGQVVAQLASESELKKRIDVVLRPGKTAGADETEVQMDETIHALSRF